MYYNIKIKSNGSEFSLESNNKEVTQREMDIYFSHIFDVSEDFKSKIKKVEIVNANVKSISEVENLSSVQTKKEDAELQTLSTENQNEVTTNLANNKILEEKNKQEEALRKAQEEIKQQEEALKKAQELAKQQQEEIRKKAQEEAKKQVEEMQRKALELALKQEEENKKMQEAMLEKQKEQTMIHTIPTETITFQNQPSVVSQTPIKNSLDEMQTPILEPKQNIANQNFKTETSSQAPEAQDDIDELISLAQQKLEIKQASNNDEIYLNFSKDNMEDLSIIPDLRIEESQIEQHYQSKIDDIFNSTSSFEQEPQMQTPTMAPNSEIEEILTTIAQEISQIDELPIVADDVTISIEEEATEQQEIETVPPQQEVIKNPEYNFLPEDENQETIEAKPTQSPMATAAEELDFKPFLAGFACSELIDEFLICAYFIKNVLRKSEFTIKFINSKLFQATGKIANLSIIDELISREYIKTIDTDEGKKYSITMDGEGYFAEKFQG